MYCLVCLYLYVTQSHKSYADRWRLWVNPQGRVGTNFPSNRYIVYNSFQNYTKQMLNHINTGEIRETDDIFRVLYKGCSSATMNQANKKIFKMKKSKF